MLGCRPTTTRPLSWAACMRGGPWGPSALHNHAILFSPNSSGSKVEEVCLQTCLQAMVAVGLWVKVLIQ